MNANFTIGRVAEAAGCKVQTIRYYEQVGLLPIPARTAVRDLLSLSDTPDQSCDAADGIARAQLVEVEQRIARLQALKTELERMIEQCRGGRIADCRVIEVLGDHALCQTDHQVTSGVRI